VTRCDDLVREMTATVLRYPRSLRFVLGDRTLTTTYDVLDLLVAARYSRDKLATLDRANLMLERLRFQLRLGHDEKVMSTGRYEELERRIACGAWRLCRQRSIAGGFGNPLRVPITTIEVGRLLGGWRRSRAESPHPRRSEENTP